MKIAQPPGGAPPGLVFRMPVSPVTKKWLEHHLPGPFMARENSFFGVVLLNGMARKTVQTKGPDAIQCARRGLSAEWRFSVPVRYRDRPVLPQTQVVRFNLLVTKMIQAEIINSLEERRLRGDEDYIERGMDAFLEQYDYSLEEFTDERFRKIYYRFRNQQDKKGALPFFRGSLV